MDHLLELKPCPFCGSSRVAVVDSFVQCGTCSAAGPYASSEEKAVQRWNNRVEPKAQEGVNPSAPSPVDAPPAPPGSDS